MAARATLRGMKKYKINGRRLAELRCERGMSQAELAAAVGVSTRTIGNVEREQTAPDLAVMVALADVFEVSLDYVCGRTVAA